MNIKNNFFLFCMGLLIGIIAFPAIANIQKSPEAKKELRKPGFIFVELETKKIDQYIEFFKQVANLKLIRHEKTFSLMESEIGQLLLMNPSELPKSHPFYGKVTGKSQGLGVEISFVVANLKQSFEAAKASGWQISQGITLRPWGVYDFRVLSPDGYYLRFTEPPHYISD
ncbi:MAG: hypothetical protein ACD_46C00507G0003 [uncultured bacterium]|nr:MAG: hypothetical protein ACD_46C00507G0003 [uncultured bacterium]